MKDLYSFDTCKDDALATYDKVQGAYAEIFQEIGVPVKVAEADTGSIGGDLSRVSLS